MVQQRRSCVSKLLTYSNKSAYDSKLLKEAVLLAAKLVSLPPRCSYHVLIKRGYGAEHSGEAVPGRGRYLEHRIYVHVDCLDFADTLVHEFCHVKDFCDAKFYGHYNRRWKNRPHEKRAIRHNENSQRKTLSQERRVSDSVGRDCPGTLGHPTFQ